MDAQTLLTGFSEFLEDIWQSATTSAGSDDGTTLVDTALLEYGTDSLKDGYIRITESGHADELEIRRVSDFDAEGAVVFFDPPLSAAIAGSISYEFHRYDPRRKFRSLNRGRLAAFPQVSIVLLNEQLTGDGFTRDFEVPTAMRTGPLQVWGETHLTTQQSWNFMPQNSWAESAGTLSTVTRADGDIEIPRYAAECRQWAVPASTAATLTIEASGLSQGRTAANLSGRYVTIGLWAYCRTADRVTLTLTDDAGTTTSSTHGGAGWEFLTITRAITGANATLFRTRINVSSGATAVLVAVEEVYGITGHRIPLTFDEFIVQTGTLRDATQQRMLLPRSPSRGQQLRLMGRAPLTSLGTTYATQSVGTMEVDETYQELLFAKAARLLLVGEGYQTGQIQTEFPKIQEAEDRFSELESDWSTRLPYSDSVRVWY